MHRPFFVHDFLERIAPWWLGLGCETYGGQIKDGHSTPLPRKELGVSN